MLILSRCRLWLALWNDSMAFLSWNTCVLAGRNLYVLQFSRLIVAKKKIELGKKLQRPLYFSECSGGTVIKKRQTKWCCVGSLVRQKTRTAILVGLELHQTPYLGLRHRDTVSSEPSQCSLDHLPCQPEDSFLVKSLKWGWSVASCCYTESLNTSVSACLPAVRHFLWMATFSL